MSENKTYNVKNRSAGSVVYAIPEMGIRREFMAGETKKLSYMELEKLTFVPGGRYLMANYLQIEEEKIIEEFNIKTEPEYYMSEADVIALLKTGELDALLDALDFAPAGIIDLIKKYSVTLPLTDTRKIEAIKEKTGFDVSNAIVHDKEDKEAEGPFKDVTPGRRVKPAETAAATPGRRTSTSYKVVNKEEN